MQGREKIHFYPKMKRRSLQNAIAKQKWLAKHSMLRVCNVNHRPNRSEYKCCREFSLVLRFQPCIYFRNETFYAYRRSSNRKMRFKSNRNNLFLLFFECFFRSFCTGQKEESRCSILLAFSHSLSSLEDFRFIDIRGFSVFLLSNSFPINIRLVFFLHWEIRFE